MTIKEEVLKSYHGAECILTGTGYYIKSGDLETPFCDDETYAWTRFKNLYCKDELISTQLQLPIIGKEYEFKSYNNWVKRKFGGFVGVDTNNNHVHYVTFREIQNPKLEELKKLADELGYEIVNQLILKK